VARKKYGGYSLGSASERLNGVKQSGSRTIREPTWYFQSKLLVSYNPKDNMSGLWCQENQDWNQVRIENAIIVSGKSRIYAKNEKSTPAPLE
jgi:hypothetical protein